MRLYDSRKKGKSSDLTTAHAEIEKEIQRKVKKKKKAQQYYWECRNSGCDLKVKTHFRRVKLPNGSKMSVFKFHQENCEFTPQPFAMTQRD